MILIVCEIKPGDAASVAKVWVNTHDATVAETLARQALREAEHSIQRIIEAIPTEKDDYFAPCTSLDAFVRAELEGICVLYE